MRKKYTNPAPLTINYAFDSRLLDLVAITYQEQNAFYPKNKSKRSFSQKKIFTMDERKNLSQMNKDKSLQKLSRQKKVTPNSTQSIFPRQSFLKTNHFSSGKKLIDNEKYQKKIASITKSTPIAHSIDQQITRNMLNKLRKNLLSTVIDPPQLNFLEQTYKKLLKKSNGF